MEVIKYAVVGTGRGKVFMSPPDYTGMKLTAVCDLNPDKLTIVKYRYDKDDSIQLFTDYDEMLEKADIDAVILANYFNEHAEFAIKALKAGKHVLSECTAMGTIGEGVALCRAVEESGKIYMIAENYPFTKARMEMKHIYESGELGELLYGEGEYAHAMNAPFDIAPGEYHWRNQIPSTYYCTHAIAPIMLITNTVPTRVNGFVPKIEDQSYRGNEVRLQDPGGIIVCEMDNGAVVRTMQGAFRATSMATRLHCTHGACEINRADGRLTVWHEGFNRGNNPKYRTYEPEWPEEYAEMAAKAGHGGGDFWVIHYFAEAIQKNEQPWLNVYRACAMSAVGILAWKSVVNGGAAYDVPKFDDEEDRKKYENDFWTPFRKEGESEEGMPPRTASPWQPTEEAYAAAKAAWEASDYLGLGWKKSGFAEELALAKAKFEKN